MVYVGFRAYTSGPKVSEVPPIWLCLEIGSRGSG